jgi:hypothetical protein
MNFVRRLRSLLFGGAPPEGQALLFYVRCDQCGEVIRVRADRRWDLLQELDDGVTGYSLHKDVLGTRCNRLLRMVVRFDRAYTITQRELHGGRFVTQAEYQATSP